MLKSIRFLNRQWTIPLLFTLPALSGTRLPRGLSPPMETSEALSEPSAVVPLLDDELYVVIDTSTAFVVVTVIRWRSTPSPTAPLLDADTLLSTMVER